MDFLQHHQQTVKNMLCLNKNTAIKKDQALISWSLFECVRVRTAVISPSTSRTKWGTKIYCQMCLYVLLSACVFAIHNLLWHFSSSANKTECWANSISQSVCTVDHVTINKKKKKRVGRTWGTYTHIHTKERAGFPSIIYYIFKSNLSVTQSMKTNGALKPNDK